MSTFGTLFRVTTFGESHCKGVGCIVDGCPPRMRLAEADVQRQLSRRRPGQSALTTPRDEKDLVQILSGTESGLTLGTPICMVVYNEDQRPGDYKEMLDVPRPSHADFTYQVKYGVRASSGGGRASARETIGRVAAGAVAQKWLREAYGVEIVAWVSSVGAVHAPRALEEDRLLSASEVDKSLVRCPHAEASASMIRVIEAARADKDSIGGVVTCVCRGLPPGWGEPCFDKLPAVLAHAMMSIPATKGFELGSGFDGTELRGSQHNDRFVAAPAAAPSDTTQAAAATAAAAARVPNRSSASLATATNNSGGTQGGISNGSDVVFRVAFKPPATIGKPQPTAGFDGAETVLEARGRHDPCVVPRAVPIVEAMAALVLADMALQQAAREVAASPYPVLGKVAPTLHAAEAAAAPRAPDAPP
jgi:chorismate synthase